MAAAAAAAAAEAAAAAAAELLAERLIALLPLETPKSRQSWN